MRILVSGPIRLWRPRLDPTSIKWPPAFPGDDDLTDGPIASYVLPDLISGPPQAGGHLPGTILTVFGGDSRQMRFDTIGDAAYDKL